MANPDQHFPHLIWECSAFPFGGPENMPVGKANEANETTSLSSHRRPLNEVLHSMDYPRLANPSSSPNRQTITNKITLMPFEVRESSRTKDFVWTPTTNFDPARRHSDADLLRKNIRKGSINCHDNRMEHLPTRTEEFNETTWIEAQQKLALIKVQDGTSSSSSHPRATTRIDQSADLPEAPVKFTKTVTRHRRGNPELAVQQWQQHAEAVQQIRGQLMPHIVPIGADPVPEKSVLSFQKEWVRPVSTTSLLSQGNRTPSPSRYTPPRYTIAEFQRQFQGGPLFESAFSFSSNESDHISSDLSDDESLTSAAYSGASLTGVQRHWSSGWERTDNIVLPVIRFAGQLNRIDYDEDKNENSPTLPIQRHPPLGRTPYPQLPQRPPRIFNSTHLYHTSDEEDDTADSVSSADSDEPSETDGSTDSFRTVSFGSATSDHIKSLAVSPKTNLPRVPPPLPPRPLRYRNELRHEDYFKALPLRSNSDIGQLGGHANKRLHTLRKERGVANLIKLIPTDEASTSSTARSNSSATEPIHLDLPRGTKAPQNTPISSSILIEVGDFLPTYPSTPSTSSTCVNLVGSPSSLPPLQTSLPNTPTSAIEEADTPIPPLHHPPPRIWLSRHNDTNTTRHHPATADFLSVSPDTLISAHSLSHIYFLNSLSSPELIPASQAPQPIPSPFPTTITVPFNSHETKRTRLRTARMERLGVPDAWDSLQSKPETRVDLESWYRDERKSSKEAVEDFPRHSRSARLSRRPERRSLRIVKTVRKGRLVRRMGNWAGKLRWRIGMAVRRR